MGRDRLFAWESGATPFVLVTSLVNALLYHVPLFSFALADLATPSVNLVVTLATLFVVIFTATAALLLLTLVLWRRLTRPLCMLFAMGNSVALYFVATYDAVLDKTMMGNVFNTNLSEVASYIHPKLFFYVLVFGVLPCLLLAKVRIRPVRRWRMALESLVLIGLGLVWVYAASSTWLWVDRHAKKLGGMVMPWSYVMNGVRYQSARLESEEPMLLPPATFVSDQPMLVVLVIGEAARADNFSLYGYHRLTNPGLTELRAIALKDAVACATYTTASLRCILSPKDASSEFGRRYEPLPSYLYRHGVDVIWRSNNWGEPAIHVESYQRARDLREDCAGTGCDHDEVLLNGLSERIRSSQQSRIFVVLHLRGSHGPSYHSEYPPRFEAFRPVCRSVNPNECTTEELVNAYDNTILYTDHVLSRTIGVLDGIADHPSVLIYVSDHGESLGEYGLYLHGTPWSIAPAVQKNIPFVVWMSRSFMDRRRTSVVGLVEPQHHSQGNVFHSVMGAFDMRSAVYDPRLDVFARAGRKGRLQQSVDAKGATR